MINYAVIYLVRVAAAIDIFPAFKLGRLGSGPNFVRLRIVYFGFGLAIHIVGVINFAFPQLEVQLKGCDFN